MGAYPPLRCCLSYTYTQAMILYPSTCRCDLWDIGKLILKWLDLIGNGDLVKMIEIVLDAMRSFCKWSIIKQGGLAALTALKEEVLIFCRSNKGMIESLAKIGVKTAARWAAETAVKAGVKRGSGAAAKYVAKGAGATAKMVNPVGIVADLAQAGLEYAGFGEACT